MLLIWVNKIQLVRDSISEPTICKYADILLGTPGTSLDMSENSKASGGGIGNIEREMLYIVY